MLRPILTWLWRIVWGKPQREKAFFVKIRGDGRVEELPSGRLVFYIDVSDVPNDRVEAYLRKAKHDLGFV